MPLVYTLVLFYSALSLRGLLPITNVGISGMRVETGVFYDFLFRWTSSLYGIIVLVAEIIERKWKKEQK